MTLLNISRPPSVTDAQLQKFKETLDARYAGKLVTMVQEQNQSTPPIRVTDPHQIKNISTMHFVNPVDPESGIDKSLSLTKELASSTQTPGYLAVVSQKDSKVSSVVQGDPENIQVKQIVISNCNPLEDQAIFDFLDQVIRLDDGPKEFAESLLLSSFADSVLSQEDQLESYKKIIDYLYDSYEAINPFRLIDSGVSEVKMGEFNLAQLEDQYSAKPTKDFIERWLKALFNNRAKSFVNLEFLNHGEDAIQSYFQSKALSVTFAKLIIQIEPNENKYDFARSVGEADRRFGFDVFLAVSDADSKHMERTHLCYPEYVLHLERASQIDEKLD